MLQTFRRHLKTLPHHLTIAATGAIVVMGWLPASTVHAGTATKTILEAGTHYPGDKVTIQIKFNRPNTTTTITPVQVEIALDTSGSTSTQLSDTKTKLTNFANSLSSYYGFVRVGIWGFGAGSSGDIFAPAVIDSTNIANLKTAINNIVVGGNDAGFSPIAEGLSNANSKFAASGTRFLVLQTDGYDNQPNGACPIAISSNSRTPGVSGIGSTDFSIVPILSGNASAGYYSKLGYSTNDVAIGGADPCRDYVNNNFSNYPNTYSYVYSGEQYSSGTYAGDLLRDMTLVYPNSHQDSTIQPQLDKVIAAAQNAQKISTITVSDLLNSSVFVTNTSDPNYVKYTGGNFTDCNGTALATMTWAPDPTTGRFTFASNSSLLNSVAQYCLNVTATILPSPTTGTVPINSASGNTVTYKNSDGTQLAQDLIGTGSISIAGTDFQVTGLETDDVNGAPKRVFQQGEPIYTKVTVANTGPSSSQSGAVTMLYDNQSSATVGQQSTISPSPGMSIAHGVFGANSSYWYGSWPTGQYNTSFSSVKSWTENSTTGVLTELAYINYDNSKAESNYNNNQLTYQYGVITSPGSLAATPTSCRAATFTWTNGSGISNYVVKVTDTDTGVTNSYSAGYVQSLNQDLGEEGPHNYTWQLVPQVNIGGTLYDGQAVSGPGFATPQCKKFTINSVGNQKVIPGASSPTIANIGFTFTGPWTTSDQITTNVIKIASGTIDCSSAAYPGSNAAVTGLSAGINTPSSASGVSNYPNGIPLSLSATSAATIGTYTVCIGARSPAAVTNPANIGVTVIVQPAGWIQVGGQNGKGAGDVHSNSAITISLPNPAATFFTTGVAGVVSANGSASIPTAQIASNGLPDWLAATYPTITTPAYASFLHTALSSQQIASLLTETVTDASIKAHCGTGASGIFQAANNPVTIANPIALDATCNGKNVIYFIPGNLAVNANIVDTSTSGTLTFFVSGNITVASSVTQMDGVYVFGGSFADGSSSNQLKVNGSLLGLAGTTPSTTTGTFSPSGITGFQRDLGNGNAAGLNNSNNPAEWIVYQPKYLALLQTLLGSSTFSWTE